MRQVKLLNAKELNDLVKQHQNKNIFLPNSEATKEILKKWKAIFGFLPTNQK